jgi:hypothetical protein
MVVVGCGLLFWNEGRAVKTAVSLEGEYRYRVPQSADFWLNKSSGFSTRNNFSLNAEKLSRKSNLF